MKMNDRANGFLWGVVVAAVVVPIALNKGFGWRTGGQTHDVARQAADVAVVKALLPICLANFHKTPDSPTKLVELKKITSPWPVGARELRQGEQMGCHWRRAGRPTGRCLRRGPLQALTGRRGGTAAVWSRSS